MAKIALTGGGTGGHVYPGIAVALAIKDSINADLFWIGSKTGIERDIVEAAGIPFREIPAGKLRRYLSVKNIADFFKVIGGFFAARDILKKEKPDMLFSKGGFVSVPPSAAAFSLGIPVFTHESDYSPGLATRINCRFARRVFTGCPDTRLMFAPRYRGKVEATGNPVRREFRSADGGRGREFLGISDDRPVLLVLGGSQGAREINELVAKALPVLTERFTVIHQTGPNWDADPPASPVYKPFAYIAGEMPDVLAAADLVLGRAGAGAVWECAVMGKPMVLIPLRGSGTRGDQVENAEFFRKAGAAVVLSDGEITWERLVECVTKLLSDGEALKAMADASAALGSVDAASKISGILIQFLREKKP